ncbi:MAG: hypothetical protein AB1645_02440 [Bacillota bacterium]
MNLNNLRQNFPTTLAEIRSLNSKAILLVMDVYDPYPEGDSRRVGPAWDLPAWPPGRLAWPPGRPAWPPGRLACSNSRPPREKFVRLLSQL